MKASGPLTAPIMIVGEAPGAEEERQGVPFVGSSGQLLTRLLAEAGIARDSCFITNVCRHRPPNNNLEGWIASSPKKILPEHLPMRDRMVMPQIANGFKELIDEIYLVQPRVIIALGNVAMWALTSKWGITKWRGSQLSAVKPIETSIAVIPTYHPAAILYRWEWRQPVLHDLRRAAGTLRNPKENPKPGWKLLAPPSFIQAQECLNRLLQRLDNEPAWVEVDLETYAGHIACCGLSWSHREAISIPFFTNSGNYWNEAEECTLVSSLQAVLTHPNIQVRWQNGLFDAQYILRHWHFVPRAMQDTMISQHTLFPSLPKALDFQASLYCSHYVYWKDDGKRLNPEASDESNWLYNCEDCLRTREVGETELEAVRKVGKEEQHTFQQLMFWPVLAAMGRGIRVDNAKKKSLRADLKAEVKEKERRFTAVLGHPLNPASSLQMTKLFYEDLRQPVVYKMKMVDRSRRYTPTTEDSALTRIGRREPLLEPLCRWIQEWRTLRVYLNTFADMAVDSDGRIRCSYNICGTKTFRLSSAKNVFGSGSNLQNFPKGGMDDQGLELPNLRQFLIPDPGYTFFDLDLSKADLRVVAWEADEAELKAMLREGRDPYVETAREFYHDDTISKRLPNGQEHPKYRTFKSFAHGTHYLGAPKGLAKNLGLSESEVERTQKWYFDRYPAIKRWQERFTETFYATGSIKNAYGYTYQCLDRLDQSALREAAAWIPQSTVALYINRIWLALFTELDSTEFQVLLQVHDSLGGQILTERLESLLQEIQRVSSTINVPYPDPLHIPIGLKVSDRSWGDCE